MLAILLCSQVMHNQHQRLRFSSRPTSDYIIIACWKWVTVTVQVNISV